jgi:hypothetical protein
MLDKYVDNKNSPISTQNERMSCLDRFGDSESCVERHLHAVVSATVFRYQSTDRFGDRSSVGMLSYLRLLCTLQVRSFESEFERMEARTEPVSP